MMSSPKSSTSHQKDPNKEDPSLMVFLSGLSGISNEKGLLRYLRTRARGVVSISFPKKSSSGYAFLTMKDKAAKQEMLKVTDLRYKKRTLKVKPFMSGERLSEFKSELNERRLFVFSLPISAKDRELKEFFSKYGEVENAYLIRDRVSRKPKSFGYVLFKDSEISKKVAEIRKFRFKGKKIKVQIHQGKKGQRAGESGKGSEYIKKQPSEGGKSSSVLSNPPGGSKTSRVGSGASGSPKSSSKRSSEGERKRFTKKKKFLRRETPTIIEAGGGVEPNQNQVLQDPEKGESSNIIDSERSDERSRVLGGIPQFAESRQGNNNNQTEGETLQDRLDSLASSRVGPSERKVSTKPRTRARNYHERLGEVPADSKRNEASPESQRDKKSGNLEIFHCLRPTNSAYFPERAEIFKEWFSKTNYRSNVDVGYLPSWKRSRALLEASNTPFHLHHQRQKGRPDWYNLTNLPSKINL